MIFVSNRYISLKITNNNPSQNNNEYLHISQLINNPYRISNASNPD